MDSASASQTARCATRESRRSYTATGLSELVLRLNERDARWAHLLCLLLVRLFWLDQHGRHPRVQARHPARLQP